MCIYMYYIHLCMNVCTFIYIHMSHIVESIGINIYKHVYIGKIGDSKIHNLNSVDDHQIFIYR
jgi:hypothetical protein